MSNDNPPRACLMDFGYMTMVLDPKQPLSCSAQLEGGTTMFMAPELLVPSKFGLAESLPTQMSDIYAFGLVIFQVRNQDHGCPSCAHAIQVLTGEVPFPGLGRGGIAMSVIEGKRPPKPQNASGLGFSDSLWDFAQRCWDGTSALRPKITEVVSQLGEATAAWNGVMAPHVVVEDDVPGTEEVESKSMSHCKLHTLMPLNFSY